MAKFIQDYRDYKIYNSVPNGENRVTRWKRKGLLTAVNISLSEDNLIDPQNYRLGNKSSYRRAMDLMRISIDEKYS